MNTRHSSGEKIFAGVSGAFFRLERAIGWLRLRGHVPGNQAPSAQTAFDACNTLLALAAHIQQHRGMSTAWLAGDLRFEPRLASKREEIEPLIDQACAVDPRGTVAAQKVKALALTIRTHMLGSQEVAVSAEVYFSEATQAIDAVFAWVRECGRRLEGEMGLAAADRRITTAGCLTAPARQ